MRGAYHARSPEQAIERDRCRAEREREEHSERPHHEAPSHAALARVSLAELELVGSALRHATAVHVYKPIIIHPRHATTARARRVVVAARRAGAAATNA